MQPDFTVGAYGTYLVVDALGWAKFISFAIIASFLIPYFRIFALVVVGILALNLVFKSGYRLTLFGKPVKAPLPNPAG